MRCSLREDLHSGFRCSGVGEANSNEEDEAWEASLLDEVNAQTPGHEAYFEGSYKAAKAGTIQLVIAL